MKRNRVVGLLLLGLLGTCATAQEVPRFAIERFAVEGNSVLRQDEVDAALRPFVGPQKDFGDVQRALEALEALYRARGYATVNVMLPEQSLENGAVALRVVEGRVRKIDVEGQRHFDADNLRATLPTLREGEVPRVDAVSANLKVINENPAKKVTLRLAPGERGEEIDAIVQVADERPWTISATLDNSGTRETGKRRLGVTFQHANLWNRDHVLTYQYQTSPDQPEDVRVHAISYRLPLYGLGDALDLYAARSTVNAGTLAAGPFALSISGSGSIIGARYSINLKRLGSYEHQLGLGFEAKKFRNDIDASGVALGNEVATHPVALHYAARWRDTASEASLFGSIALNVPGGNNGRQDAFDTARHGSSARFRVARGGLSASHAFANDWQARFSGSFQWADEPLIPQEQLGIGGAGSVRGFQEREIADDRGFATSLEVYTPELCRSTDNGHQCRALAFIDSGAVYRVDPLPGEREREHVASIGLGMRYSWDRRAALQADYGHVLQGGGGQARGDWRLHVRLGVFF